MTALPLPSETVSFSDPAIANLLFGPCNANLDVLSDASRARISNKGTQVFIESDDAKTRQILCSLFLQVYSLLRAGQTFSPQDMRRAYDMLCSDPGIDLTQVFQKAVFVRTPGKTVTARNMAQKRYLESLTHNDIVIAVGPAGTGKTYLAVAMALSMLHQHRIKRILLTRPAVEAGERLGFLPGDLAEKINPYLRPLYDALHDMLPPQKVSMMLESGTIEIAPLAFMRGRTLNDAFIILDEAQNTTQEQMKMFLTRMGFGSRMVVTGDATQIDLPPSPRGEQARSGLIQAMRILHAVPGIAIHHFSPTDVVRHPLVGAIVNAYDSTEKKQSPD